MPPPTFPQRPGRALIGWLSIGDGALALSGQRKDHQPSAEIIQRCDAARQAVARRPIHVDGDDLFGEVPPAVADHVAALRADPATASALADAGDPRMIDLTKVRAIRPDIHVEDARRRVKALTDDALAMARMTMPLPDAAEQAPIAFDERNNAWIVASPNPNLRVIGHFVGPANVSGAVALGFTVAVMNSMMQIVGVSGRYFLRDGYHRAYGLLAAGIARVPAFVKHYESVDQSRLPAGVLPPAVFLGDRPPLLPDYLDDEVAADITVAIPQKIVLVQAPEFLSVE